MLGENGASYDKFRFFVDGDGLLFHPNLYDQITPEPPASWQYGKGAYAHFSALKSVVRQAQADDVRNLLWVEDDCVFSENFDQSVRDATRQMGQGGHRWDLLYYGANHSWATTYDVTPNVIRCYGSLTTHCVGIPNHMFDPILLLPEVHVIDKVIADSLHHQYACYAIWPPVALQKPGYSHISRMETDYNHYFKCKGANWARA
jgi:hypothetical protein